MEKVKRYIRDNKKALYLTSCVYRIIMNNRIRKKGLTLRWKGVFSRGLHVVSHGIHNTLDLGEGCRIYNSKIQFFGNHNSVCIMNDCVLRDVDIWISDGGEIRIDHNTHFSGKIHLACIEGKKIQIGERCLFSNDIVIRTGDSHSVLDRTTHVRLNPAQNVAIGNHCWIGHKAIILKGAEVSDDSVVGTGAIVTGKNYPGHAALAGVPARIVREGVTWDPRNL